MTNPTLMLRAYSALAGHLDAIRILLSTPEMWTKEQFAKDETGIAVDPGSCRATCFCIEGAIERMVPREAGCASFEPWYKERRKIRLAISRAILRYWPKADLVPFDKGMVKLTRWQDRSERTHADIMLVLNEAYTEVTEPGFA